MKDFFKWFKSEAKIKRWIFLMIIGIILVCYGTAKILVTQEITFEELAQVIASFTFGFTFTVVSIICIQKRTLELLVQESDTRDVEKGKKINSLIFNKKVYNQGPKIVVIGGGAGLNTVLKGLKNYTDNITAIVTVSNYGNIVSNSSEELKDIKESIIALSNNEEKMSDILNYNIKNKNLSEVNFGDIYLKAIQEITGDFSKAIQASTEILNITGKVLPVTLDFMDICAELEDGTVVKSKAEIPQVVNEKISKISRIYISPTNCRVAPGVLEEIKQADAIVIGPGSLFTNVIPNLLIPGVSKEIKESKGLKIYVSNIMTEVGQTDDYSLSEHTKAIIDHAGKGIIEYCIYDTGEIVPEYIRQYNKQGAELVEQDIANVKVQGINLIQRNLSKIENDKIHHNPDAIATTIIQLICDDLKFRDMQNDTQYLMLESKVKDTKRKLREESKQNKKSKHKKSKDIGKTSKFSEKYTERIESIKQSETRKKTQKEKKVKTQNEKKAINNKEKPRVEKVIRNEEKNKEEEKVKNLVQRKDKNKTNQKKDKNNNIKEKKSIKNTKVKNLKEDEDFMNIINNMRK